MLFAHLPRSAALPFSTSISAVASSFRRGDPLTHMELRTQWLNPADTLSVLLVIGGDIVQKALAQTTGGRIAPVCFSFGWVAYSFTSIIALVGDGRLMPNPDFPCKVINANSGYTRESRSWVLGRILRDGEEPLTDEALSVTVYESVENKELQQVAGKPTRGRLWFVGHTIMLVQLGIAAIPLGLYDDWGIFLVTVVGTLLALVTGALKQWKVEKYACRTGSKKNIVLTAGNGARHAMVILGKGKGLDFEDLAGGEGPRMGRPWENHGWFVTTGTNNKPRAILFKGLPLDFWLTRVVCLSLAVVWIALLISVAGLKQNAWFLLLVGAIGMFQNAYVAGVDRKPSKRGVHLKPVKKFTGKKVMDVLMDLEVAHNGIGRCMLREFFPGGLKEEHGEVQWWNGDREQYDNKRIKNREERGSPMY